VDERLRFIAAVNESDESFSELCRQFGISRKTGYKWCKRYEQFGPAGLEDRAPIPRSCPHATPPEMLDLILELRKERPTWGPKKIRARLQTLGYEGGPGGQHHRRHPQETRPDSAAQAARLPAAGALADSAA
jgi:transposase-like protein